MLAAYRVAVQPGCALALLPRSHAQRTADLAFEREYVARLPRFQRRAVTFSFVLSCAVLVGIGGYIVLHVRRVVDPPDCPQPRVPHHHRPDHH